MGVTMKLKGLKELGQRKWEYRKRIPASAQEVLGRSERKEVIEAYSDQDLMRKYARVVAKIDAEIAAAKAPPSKLTPRVAWEIALKEAEKLDSGVYGIADPDEARELVAEDLVSRGHTDPLIVAALMDPENRHPDNPKPKLTLQDALNVYVKEKLGGGAGPEHRGTMLRLDRVVRHAEEAGLPAMTALHDMSRDHARKVRD